MSPTVRRILLIVALLLGVLVLLGLVGFMVGGSRLGQRMDVGGHELAIPDDPAAIQNGDRLATAYGCRDCHGQDLGGDWMINEPAFAVIAAPNLTQGRGSAVVDFGPADWDRALRHGVRPDGRVLFIMPSSSYAKFSDQDMGEIVAFLKSAPAVNRSFDPPRFGPAARMAVLASGEELLPATAIDHTAAHVASVERTVSPRFGAYLAQGCAGCHGSDFSGGRIAGSDIPAANITPDEDTGIGGWTYNDFNQAIRHGVRPDGGRLDGSAMPWPSFAALTDDEVRSLWLFFRDLPAVEKAWDR